MPLVADADERVENLAAHASGRHHTIGKFKLGHLVAGTTELIEAPVTPIDKPTEIVPAPMSESTPAHAAAGRPITVPLDS